MSKSQPQQQQPLPQSVILGCNAFNCASKISNANWETKLNEQVIVNQGDSIGVKASFIDTRGTASGNIVITKDTEISLEYYFYWMHTFNACDPSGITTSSADASDNLTQQVLVGQSIPYLYNAINADVSANVPGYLTVGDPSGNFAATRINDADGLPYIVYQSSNTIPVPPVLGPVIPAWDIVPGTTYVVHSQGISTNWQYAGVPLSIKNKLSSLWTLDVNSFVAAANPDGVNVPFTLPLYDNPGMSPNEFLLPANVLPTLPYVSYMITVVGNTDWVAIDPNLVSTTISASQMVAGTEYAIDVLGNLNWVALGAASNASGEEFVYTPPPNAPPDFPITLNNAFFLANATAFINPGFPAFGASPDDNFQCVIGVDVNFNYTLNSYSGSGQWCYDISGSAYWNIPPALFGVSTAVCPTATNLIITGFSATSATGVPVASLVAGDVYTVATTGVLDPSNPPFTWNMVSNLPTTDTSLMVAGNQYQVYEYNNVVIPYAPHQGVPTDVFISQGPIAAPGPTYSLLNYNSNAVPPLPATPNIFVTVSVILDGVPYSFVQGVINLNVTSDYQGKCVILPNSSIISDNNPFLSSVANALVIINGPAQAGYPAINVTFVANSLNGDFSADFTSIINFPQDIYTPPPPFPSGKPSKLVQLQDANIISTATYTYNFNTPTSTGPFAAASYQNQDGGFIFPSPTEPTPNPPPEPTFWVSPWSVTVSASPDGLGNFYYVPYPTSVAVANGGFNWGYNYPAGTLLTLNGPAQTGDLSFQLQFSLTSWSTENSGFGANVYTMNLVSSTPAKFPTVLGPIPFIASGPYTGTGSTSTANGLLGTLSTATVSGKGYLQGSVYNTPPKVGTIVQSLFPDPGAPPVSQPIIFTDGYYSGTPTPNLLSILSIYLDGVLFDLTPYYITNTDIYLPIFSDVNGNCIIGYYEHAALIIVESATSDWLNGVTTVKTVINGPAYPGGPIVNATFTSTGAQLNIADGEVLGFTPAPLMPFPFNPSTGRAVLYPIPNTSDGSVQEVLTPATTKLDVRPVKKKWKMTLKAGSYDPNYLAELISRNMSKQRVKRVNNVTGGPFGTQSTLTVPTDSIYNTQTADWANSGGSGQNTFYDSKNTNVYGFPSQTDYNINPDNDDMPFLFVPSMNSSVLHATQPQTPPDYIFAEIPHPNANGLNNLPSPKYYINLVPLISDVRSVSPTIPTDISGGYYSILPFYSQNTVAAGDVDGHGGIFPVAYGATQTSLLYNNEGNGLFSFNYMHSPILAFLSSATNDLTECTAHMFTTQKVSTNMKNTNFFTTLIDKKSGVLLNKMNPPSFWNQLGFNIEALTVDLDDKPPGFQMTLNDFESRTTGGFCGSSNIFNGTFHTKGSADQPSVPDTELLFLTGTVGPSNAVTIIPFTNQTPDMVIGVTYTIATIGTWYIGGQGQDPAVDWSYVGTAVNPGDDITNVYVGMPIIATNNWDGSTYYVIEGGSPVLKGFWYIPPAQPNGQIPSVLLGSGSGSTTTQLQNNYFQVQNTNTLNAVKIPTVRDQTGHFLIELIGYNSIYLDDKSKREIKSIVSSYFVSQGSFVAQVFPESYNYYHVGSPISLSNLKIRILDPFTSDEAQIGPNSSVYIQVNKMLSDIAIAQIEN